MTTTREKAIEVVAKALPAGLVFVDYKSAISKDVVDALISAGLLQEWIPIPEDPRDKPKGDQLVYWPKSQSGRYPLPPMMRVDNVGSTPARRPSHYQPLPAPPEQG